MRGQLKHQNQEASTRSIWLPSNPSCDGQVKQLYMRRTNPQRWIVVGAYCTKCGAVAVGPEPE